MNKLFAPLNEQIEVVRIKNTPINETEIINTTNNIIFSNKINKLNEYILNEGMFFNKIHWPGEIKTLYNSYSNLYEKSYSLTDKFVKIYESSNCKSCIAKNTKFDFKSSRCISTCKNKATMERLCISIDKIEKEIDNIRKNLALMIYNFCLKKKVKLKKYNTNDIYSFNEIITNPNDNGNITKLIELINGKGIYVIK